MLVLLALTDDDHRASQDRHQAHAVPLCRGGQAVARLLGGAGFQPGATDRQNRIDKRQRELEAEIRSLRKQLAEKDEVIDVLKKSVGIFSKL